MNAELDVFMMMTGFKPRHGLKNRPFRLRAATLCDLFSAAGLGQKVVWVVEGFPFPVRK